MKSATPALAMKSATPALRATPSPTKGNEKPLFPFIYEGVPAGRGSCFYLPAGRDSCLKASAGHGNELRKLS